MKKRENRTCENCMKEAYCDERRENCPQHKDIYEKLANLGMTSEEYEEFSRDWKIVTSLIKCKTRKKRK